MFSVTSSTGIISFLRYIHRYCVISTHDKNIKYKNKDTQKDNVLTLFVFSMCTELSCVTLDVDMGSRIEGSASVYTWAHLVHGNRAWSMCEDRMLQFSFKTFGLSNWRQGRLACRGEGTTGGGDRYLTGLG